MRYSEKHIQGFRVEQARGRPSRTVRACQVHGFIRHGGLLVEARPSPMACARLCSWSFWYM